MTGAGIECGRQTYPPHYYVMARKERVDSTHMDMRMLGRKDGIRGFEVVDMDLSDLARIMDAWSDDGEIGDDIPYRVGLSE